MNYVLVRYLKHITSEVRLNMLPHLLNLPGAQDRAALLLVPLVSQLKM